MSIKFSEQKSRYMVWKWNRWFEIEKYLWKHVSFCPHLCPITILSTSQDSYADTLSSTQTTVMDQVRFLSCKPKKINCFYFAIPVSAWVRKPQPFRFLELDWEIKSKTGLELLFAFFDLLLVLSQVFGENPTLVHLCLVLYKQLLFRKYNWLVSC